MAWSSWTAIEALDKSFEICSRSRSISLGYAGGSLEGHSGGVRLERVIAVTLGSHPDCMSEPMAANVEAGDGKVDLDNLTSDILAQDGGTAWRNRS